MATDFFRRHAQMQLRANPLRMLLGVLDAGGMVLAWLMTSALLGYAIGPFEVAFIAIIVGVRIGALWLLGTYRQVLRYAGIHAAVGLIGGLAVGSAVMVATASTIERPSVTFIILEGFLVCLLCAGTRLSARLWFGWNLRTSGSRVLIFGAGGLGEATCRALLRSQSLHPVAFIDDHAGKRGGIIHGRRIVGGLKDLSAIAKRYRAEALIIAVNGLERERLKAVFDQAIAVGLRVMKVTGVDAMVAGKGELSFGDLALEDLLRRPRRNLDPVPVATMLGGCKVLVTGAGGSIGSELCRQVCLNGAKRLIMVDSSEPALYLIGREIADRFPGVDIIEVLADVAWAQAINDLMQREKPDLVFHAAAYKHVPLVEANPIIGIRNNVTGFLNVAQACIAAAVPRLILISTDKAVRPTNVMGATKRVCEVILQALPASGTHLGAVRFGNVLGSSGSVVPRFLAQIAAGGPVTVTHPDITRYFMLIPEAVELVLQAGALADHGEIFILDMGEPVRIADMAKHLILLTGHVPDKDIAITYTGLRPGEKLYEELLVDESERRSSVEGITVARNSARTWAEVESLVRNLLSACDRRDQEGMVAALRALVPEWVPSGGLGQAATAHCGVVEPGPAVPARD